MQVLIKVSLSSCRRISVTSPTLMMSIWRLTFLSLRQLLRRRASWTVLFQSRTRIWYSNWRWTRRTWMYWRPVLDCLGDVSKQASPSGGGHESANDQVIIEKTDCCMYGKILRDIGGALSGKRCCSGAFGDGATKWVTSWKEFRPARAATEAMCTWWARSKCSGETKSWGSAESVKEVLFKWCELEGDTKSRGGSWWPAWVERLQKEGKKQTDMPRGDDQWRTTGFRAKERKQAGGKREWTEESAGDARREESVGDERGDERYRCQFSRGATKRSEGSGGARNRSEGYIERSNKDKRERSKRGVEAQSGGARQRSEGRNGVRGRRREHNARRIRCRKDRRCWKFSADDRREPRVEQTLDAMTKCKWIRVDKGPHMHCARTQNLTSSHASGPTHPRRELDTVRLFSSKTCKNFRDGFEIFTLIRCSSLTNITVAHQRDGSHVPEVAVWEMSIVVN